MPKMTQKELEAHQAEIQAWLDKGNKITICEPGARTEDIKTNMWGGKKKKAPTPPVEATKEVNTTTTKK
jgi:sugar/nucleoside kinase (ribokinase family)